MATRSDLTAFRTLSEDGEAVNETAPERGLRLFDFALYTATQGQPRTVTQWYVPRTEEMLAEVSEFYGIVTYPDADLFD